MHSRPGPAQAAWPEEETPTMMITAQLHQRHCHLRASGLVPTASACHMLKEILRRAGRAHPLRFASAPLRCMCRFCYAALPAGAAFFWRLLLSAAALATARWHGSGGKGRRGRKYWRGGLSPSLRHTGRIALSTDTKAGAWVLCTVYCVMCVVCCVLCIV